jgi:hypothetical protein
MLDAAKNLENISDPDIRNDTVVALQEQIVAAQESYSALLEAEVADCCDEGDRQEAGSLRHLSGIWSVSGLTQQFELKP